MSKKAKTNQLITTKRKSEMEELLTYCPRPAIAGYPNHTKMVELKNTEQHSLGKFKHETVLYITYTKSNTLKTTTTATTKSVHKTEVISLRVWSDAGALDSIPALHCFLNTCRNKALAQSQECCAHHQIRPRCNQGPCVPGRQGDFDIHNYLINIEN